MHYMKNNTGHDGAIVWILLPVARDISQKLNDTCNITLHLALKYINNCQLEISLIVLGCLDEQILV